MGKLATEVKRKTLVLQEVSRISKEKSQEVKSWEERYAKSTASHDEEVKKLDSRLAGKQVFTCDWFYFSLEVILPNWSYSFQNKRSK